MKANLLSDFRRIVTLFAGFLIGMHVAVFLHELGHAVGFWISGGTVTRIVMESPLPAGRVEGYGPNGYAHFWVWGGVVFGSVITMAPLAIAWYLSRPSLLKFTMLMVAAFCLSHNGMYLFVGSMLPFADASNMIALGAPRWLLFLLGVPLIAAFMCVLTRAIQMVGISPAESVGKWIIIVLLGLFTFLAVMVASLFFMPVPASLRSPTIAFASCYAICFCISALRARAATVKRDSQMNRVCMPTTWSAAGGLVFAGVVLIVAEWLAFGAT